MSYNRKKTNVRTPFANKRVQREDNDRITEELTHNNTSVKISLHPDTTRNRRVAYGSMLVADVFVIFISVYANKDGYFVSYPSYKDKDGNFHDFAFCIDKGLIEHINAMLSQMLDSDDDDLF